MASRGGAEGKSEGRVAHSSNAAGRASRGRSVEFLTIRRAELTFTEEEGEEEQDADEEEDEAGAEPAGGEGDPLEGGEGAGGGGDGGEGDGGGLRLIKADDGLLRPQSECLVPLSPSVQAAGEAKLQGAGRVAADAARWSRDASVASLDLLILVLSSRHKELGPGKRRDAVRRAWAHESDLGPPDAGSGVGAAQTRCAVRFLFVMGEPALL